jgi:hypothetical protein
MEELLILSRPEAPAIRQSIESKAKVVQEGSDKLLVVEGSPDAIRAAAALPGVATAGSLAAGAAEKLSPSEQVFLEAWRQRQAAGEKKPRIGEGLSWGTKGFKAP